LTEKLLKGKPVACLKFPLIAKCRDKENAVNPPVVLMTEVLPTINIFYHMITNNNIQGIVRISLHAIGSKKHHVQ